MRLIDIGVVIAYIACFFLTDAAEMKAMSVFGLLLYTIFAIVG